MLEEVFDQNDGSESAADESGTKKKSDRAKRRGVLYIISASAVEGRLLVQMEIISMRGLGMQPHE